jgi:hypothetical protein
MVDANKIIEDIIKGAQATEGFIRGGTMGVERQVLGEETKLANNPGAGAALGNLAGVGGEYAGMPGGMAGQMIGAPVGAAIAARPGHRMDAAKGTAGGGLLGTLGGGLTGAAIGAILKDPMLASELANTMARGGGAVGSVVGANEARSTRDQIEDKIDAVKRGSVLSQSMMRGINDAAAHFKVANPIASIATKLLASGAGKAAIQGGAMAAGGNIGNKLTAPSGP